jgi:ATP synthase protein I
MEKEKNKKPLFKVLLDASALGINFVLCVLIGVGIGYLIDSFIKTFPLFSLIFLIAGFAAGIREIFRFLKKEEDTDGQGTKQENK